MEYITDDEWDAALRLMQQEPGILEIVIKTIPGEYRYSVYRASDGSIVEVTEGLW